MAPAAALPSKPLVCPRAAPAPVDTAWKKAAAAWLEAKAAIDAAKDKIIELANQESCYGAGVKHLRTPQAGSVNYAKVPELEGVDLEPYRGAGGFRTTVSAI